VLLPQVGQTPQSTGQLEQVSPLLQAPSPQPGQMPQSGVQELQDSPAAASQTPLPHFMPPELLELLLVDAPPSPPKPP
jgi:hypothetical protein